MSVKGIFVTGTDTGVGKTVVAAALLSMLRRSGIDAVPMKPIHTGCVRCDEGWRAPDLEFCLNCAELDPDADEESRMAPYCFEPACSPHLAARQEGVRISLERIAECLRELKARRDFVVVEGAGGVLVPIAEGKSMLDLMVTLGLPVVLVARPGLGTINHTLLSLRELVRAGLRIVGVVLNETSPTEWGDIEEDNLETIERLGNVQVLACMKYAGNLERGAVSPAAFLAAATGSLPPVREMMDRITSLSSKTRHGSE
jgi:dethiobiotin synthetase